MPLTPEQEAAFADDAQRLAARFIELVRDGTAYRDVCAILAMNGILSRMTGSGVVNVEGVAAMSYAIADAMARQRVLPPGQEAS